SYNNSIWDLMEDFEEFNIDSIPRKKNEDAVIIVAIRERFNVVDNIKWDRTQPHIK
ncbi:hypothetical protein KI387_007769, partial [Taxus chinensis]